MSIRNSSDSRSPWGVIRLPAFIVVGVWFLFQYVGAFSSLEFPGTKLGGTAYWDHVGGFLAGVGIIRGMVYYLNRKQADMPEEEEAESQEEIGANDSLGNFLPAETKQPGERRGVSPT